MNAVGQALLTVLSRMPEAPVALSGGLDSWVVALLLRRLGRQVRGYSLVSGIPGYCEWEQVQALSRQFQVEVEPVAAGDFEEALPRFLGITRTPVYNLHPVSKLLLAEGLAACGVTAIFTGDGADQVFRREAECDLRPLTEACFRHAGVELLSPYLAPELAALCVTPDPDKLPLRALAASLGIPPIPKRPTYYPGASILERTARMLAEANLCAASLD